MTRFLPLALLLVLAGCAASRPTGTAAAPPASGFNLAHLDYLGEDVVLPGAPADTLRIVHIYAEAPDWRFVGDDDEGIACVDDAARAAVVYLRHYELTRTESSRRTAVKLLRFIRHQQAPNGLFYNFVWDRTMRPNTDFRTSVADSVSWWTARAVWALGTGARVLAGSPEAAADVAALRRVEPHLDGLLQNHGQTAMQGDKLFPTWLIARTGSDATSELLLGLVELERAAPTEAGTRRARQFAEGLGMLRFGSLAASPWGGHASWEGGWHGWGNSQTQALAGGVGVLDPSALVSASAEANTLYAHLLVEGWRHEITYGTDGAPDTDRTFELIAYDVRPAAVGLVRLHAATGEARYGVMAGLAAAWFAGDNPAGAVMADPTSGRGYDGILAPDRINGNAGAESTIEAQMTLLEVGQNAVAAPWMHARSAPARSGTAAGRALRFRIWTAPDARRAVVVLDAAANESAVHVGPDADAFLASLDP